MKALVEKWATVQPNKQAQTKPIPISSSRKDAALQILASLSNLHMAA